MSGGVVILVAVRSSGAAPHFWMALERVTPRFHPVTALHMIDRCMLSTCIVCIDGSSSGLALQSSCLFSPGHSACFGVWLLHFQSSLIVK